jgi:hypothetical protein
MLFQNRLLAIEEILKRHILSRSAELCEMRSIGAEPLA